MSEATQNTAIPASAFSPSLVHCPGCKAVLKQPPQSCPHCGYDAQACVQRFPYAAPSLEGVLDPEGRLSQADQRRVRDEIERLAGRFPQIKVHLCLAPLPAGVDVREFGFWLFNAAPLANESEAVRRPWSILIVIDVGQTAASLTVGYQLDPHLSDEVLTAIIGSAKEEFRNGQWAHGIARIFAALHRELGVAQRSAKGVVHRWSRSEEGRRLRQVEGADVSSVSQSTSIASEDKVW